MGKPISHGGIDGRVEATGLGVHFATVAYLSSSLCDKSNFPSGDMDGCKVSVQGFGDVGYHVAKFMSEEGAKIVCIGEYDGCLHNEAGIDIAELRSHVDATGSKWPLAIIRRVLILPAQPFPLTVRYIALLLAQTPLMTHSLPQTALPLQLPKMNG